MKKMNFFQIMILISLLFLALKSWSKRSDFSVFPYLQNITQTSATIMWEGDFKALPKFRWSIDKENWYSINPDILKLPTPQAPEKRKLYQIKLRNLIPGRTYYYIVDNSIKQEFITTRKKIDKFAFIATADAQQGYRVTTRNVRESIMKHAFNKKLSPSFLLFPGDLVKNGYNYWDWTQHWFIPMAPLLSKVPVYPALGNHERDDALYFSYFDLPKNGTLGYEEHWYYFDYGNLRAITLDSNSGYRGPTQLNWLRDVLEEAQMNDKIDFVLAQFHHPYHSELWINGNLNYSGKIQNLLDDFSLRTGKPTLYICGHTHGYSRGHSLKSNHTMLVVASVGGHVDEWGEYAQRDYPEYIKTFAQHGWMWVEVAGGKHPKMDFYRYSFGNNKNPHDQGIVDTFQIKRYNENPLVPSLIETRIVQRSGNIYFKLSPFIDPDHDGQLTTHIQITPYLNHFNRPLINKVVHKENWYYGKNKNKSVRLDLIKINFSHLSHGQYYFRVRYRDNALGWSDWSDPVMFRNYKL